MPATEVNRLQAEGLSVTAGLLTPGDNPRLRGDLRILPTQTESGRAVVIQDPLGLMSQPMAVGGQALELLPLLDGRRSIPDLQTELTRRYGILITSEQVAEVIQKLDESYLLEGKRYQAGLEGLVREFGAMTSLPASHAGEAYPADPDMLRSWIDALLDKHDAANDADDEVVAIVAPHIDPRVGAEVYAAAYAPLRGAEFDRVVILGVGHSLRDGPLCLTTKDVETPLGRLSCDSELAGELRSAAGESASADDFAFRGEHSVEFQAVILRHVLRNEKLRVVPVLCSGLEPLLEGRSRASGVPGVGAFCELLREALDEGEQRTLLLAGVDLSHVGPKFGDAMSARAIAPESEEHDRKLLDALTASDPESFCAEEKATDGRFNVCGFSALACLLEALPPGTTGRVAATHNWHEEATNSAVSFAAAVFSRQLPVG
jgi:MEMO1 family protein